MFAILVIHIQIWLKKPRARKCEMTAVHSVYIRFLQIRPLPAVHMLDLNVWIFV